MGATLSSLRSTPAEMDTAVGIDFTYLSFCCRAHAIEILNQAIGSASDTDNTQWKQISDMISKYDVKMSDKTLKKLEKSRDSANSSILERIKIVSDAFDTGLLSYLQAKVDLMKMLGDWLPNQGQKWEDFLRDRLENAQPDARSDKEFILPHLEPDAGPEVLERFKNQTRKLMLAIEGVDEDVKRSGVSRPVQEIKVFYATNRLWSDGSYTSEAGDCLRYGFQQVSIPGVHKRGKLESPMEPRRGNDSEHFMLAQERAAWPKSNEFMTQIKREFGLERAQNSHSANDIGSSTSGTQKNAREVLLYIHGYTVSYNRALKRAAQLKNDLKFEGVVILFSWPTMGHPLAYSRDGQMIGSSAKLLRELITTILGEVSSSEVHILAHSMGNRALIAALSERRYEEQRRKPVVHKKGVLKNVILAAADETLEKFEVMLKGMLREWYWPDSVPSPLISVYSSACDWPLFLSGYINWQSRLGNTVSLFANHSMRRWDHVVDVIDASGVRCNSLLQHSYHAEAPEVLNDIQKLLTEQKGAGERPVIEPLLHDSGRVFHAFVPSWWDQSRFNGCVKRIQNQALPTTVTDGYE